MLSGNNEPGDRPRSMRHAETRDQRRAMLDQPHVVPLTAYVAELRSRKIGEVPDFDPLDGGIHARILFLFEKPGPMTSGKEGSGFISRNNDDPTAEATFHFMQDAGIPRKLIVSWNVVPWWNGTRKVTSQELRNGVACVRELTALLPQLSTVVLVGGKAERAREYLQGLSLTLMASAHPSPLVRARYPDQWRAIPSMWKKAMDSLAL